MQIEELLKIMVDKGASDMHIKMPMPPVFRIDGDLIAQDDLPKLTVEYLDSLYEQITSNEQRNSFLTRHELDFSYSVSGLARFRVNVMQQRGTKSLAFRYIPYETPTIDHLKMPQVLKKLVLEPRGLILITGPTGSGKSTTLAAMINHLNENARRNVITIEDPIEFLYRDNKCLIRQRDIGDDTASFYDALLHALRHDVDVIVLGEMRDLDTISTAMSAAETGHLVLGTLHTNNAVQTIDRVIDMFPHGHQEQIRQQLGQVLGAIISQLLMPQIDGGQTAAFEILIANDKIRELIRDERTDELLMFMSHSHRDGMLTLNQSLRDLINSGKVSQAQARLRSYDRSGLEKLINPEQIYG